MPRGLFDRSRSRSGPAGPKKYLSVSALTRRIKKDLEKNIGAVWVVGEVSNLRRPASGHAYFTLKDEASQISAVLFRQSARFVKFPLKDGDTIAVFGAVTVYEQRGSYQIVVERAEPVGEGGIELALKKRREKLQKEGLFDPARKRPLPFLPRRIGVVTSPTGAAVRDIIKTIRSRFPPVEIVVAPVKVQGEGAKEEIAAAIAALNALAGVDVLIVGRGGGSIEDLAAFNEEAVARAIYGSNAPVVSAVGHEIDVSIADLVADARAVTPTDAGQMVVPVLRDIVEKLARLRQRLAGGLVARRALHRETLRGIARSHAFTHPFDRVRQYQQTLDSCSEKLARGLQTCVAESRRMLAAMSGRFENLSPLKVLARGYSITSKSGAVATRARDLRAGDTIGTVLAKGRVESVVKKVLE